MAASPRLSDPSLPTSSALCPPFTPPSHLPPRPPGGTRPPSTVAVAPSVSISARRSSTRATPGGSALSAPGSGGVRLGRRLLDPVPGSVRVAALRTADAATGAAQRRHGDGRRGDQPGGAAGGGRVPWLPREGPGGPRHWGQLQREGIGREEVPVAGHVGPHDI
ncbi:hypothetical protein BHM03_00034861 [Ensete ventricosum]|nr:hypothetical protein BHM03_00034861 [Ensete ventricosum]